jgi:short-subunit dehydrogenase
MKLENKRVIITGAAGGFGGELTKLLCSRGSLVDALDINTSALKKLQKELSHFGYSIATHSCDVTEKSHFAKYAAQLHKEKKSPDVWINNAGLAFPQAFHKMSADHFEKIMAVNFLGVVNGTRVALSFMKEKQNGFIVNMASVAGHVPAPFMAPYVAAKHAVVGFTRALQLEMQQMSCPIKFCLVSPGFSNTEIMKCNPEEFAFPPWLSFLVSSPHSVALDIIHAIESEKEEITPTLSAPAVLKLYRYAPKSVFRLFSRALTARNWKELIGLEGIHSRD